MMMNTDIEVLRSKLNEQRLRSKYLKSRLERLSLQQQSVPPPTTKKKMYFRDNVDWKQAINDIKSAYSMWKDDSVERELEAKRVASEVNQIASRSAEAASTILKDFSRGEEDIVKTLDKEWENMLYRGLELLQNIRDIDESSAKLVFDTRKFLYFAHRTRNFMRVSNVLKEIRRATNLYSTEHNSVLANDLKDYISNLTQYIILSDRFSLEKFLSNT